jgi:hypothetical protein
VSTKSAAVSRLIDSNAADFYDRPTSARWALCRAKIYLQKLDRSNSGTTDLNPQRFAGMDVVKELE